MPVPMISSSWSTQRPKGESCSPTTLRNFFALHTHLIEEGKTHGGLILAPQQRYSVGEQMRRILRMSRELSSEQMENRLEFLSSWG